MTEMSDEVTIFHHKINKNIYENWWFELLMAEKM